MEDVCSFAWKSGVGISRQLSIFREKRCRCIDADRRFVPWGTVRCRVNPHASDIRGMRWNYACGAPCLWLLPMGLSVWFVPRGTVHFRVNPHVSGFRSYSGIYSGDLPYWLFFGFVNGQYSWKCGVFGPKCSCWMRVFCVFSACGKFAFRFLGIRHQSSADFCLN